MGSLARHQGDYCLPPSLPPSLPLRPAGTISPALFTCIPEVNEMCNVAACEPEGSEGGVFCCCTGDLCNDCTPKGVRFNTPFLTVKYPGCYKITTVFSHAQTVVLCVSYPLAGELQQQNNAKGSGDGTTVMGV